MEFIRSKSVSSWARTTLPASAVRTRTGLIFLVGISVLVLTTLGATYWINVLIKQDTQKIILLEHLQTQLLATPPQILPLEQGLHILLDGGELITDTGEKLELLPEGDPQLVETLQKGLSLLADARDPLPDHALELKTNLELTFDRLLQLFEIHRANNLGMARGMYAALFLSITTFLLIGLWFTEEFIAKPLEELVQITDRIAGGDLDTPIELRESDEFKELATGFEAMRLELRESRERLERWANELEDRIVQRTQQLAALTRVVTAASRSLELEEILSTALEQALQVVGVETGGVWLVDENSGDLKLVVSHGMSEEMLAQVAILQAGTGVTGQAAEMGEIIVLEDIHQSSAQIKQVAIREGLRSLVAVPIKVHGRVVAVLDVMTRRQRSFTAEEITLINSIAQQIGIGVENARLIVEIRQQSERVAALQEREWISAELHDGLLQTLSYLHLKADQMESEVLTSGLPEMAQQLARQRQVLEQISLDIRRFITNLREAPPPPMSLQAALQKMVAELWPDTSLQVTLDLTPPELRLRAEYVAHLVRIAREAVLNARHGQARGAVIALRVEDQTCELSVQDDGLGFQPDRATKPEGEHFGLSIMRARAARIGGQFSVHSIPGQGTRVTVTWPR